MATYKVGLSADQSKVHIALGAALLPAGYTQIGTFDHDDTSDDADDELNPNNKAHVLVHHVQEILGRTSREDPTEPALFPDNITDLSRIQIYTGWGNAPLVTTAPAITGTAQEGQTLTSTTGTWTGPTPTYARQWKADGVDISGATASTYVVLVGDVDKKITVSFTATNDIGSTTVLTAETATVIAA